jgi:multidrug efflux pump subunit AcrA (membrane-fusion protein)
VEKVWVVHDGQAVERVVATGRRDRDWVEVLAGLDEGQVVVCQPPAGLAGPVIARRANRVAQAEAAGQAEGPLSP